jgi:energy-coupling factor transporter ATP-binding protein EcfA2
LDPDGIQSVAGLIRGLAGTRTVMVVTHTERIRLAADRTVVVDGGLAANAPVFLSP